MKLLILSTATGQGHNSASRALGEYLESRGCTAVLMDVLESGKRKASSPVSNLYAGITVHAPWFFGLLYGLGDLISSSRRRSPIYYLNSLYAKQLLRKIEAVDPDVIVCPHLFSAQAVTFLKEQYGLATPSAAIATDYTCSPFWEETRLDYYIIPSKALLREFAGKGIPAEKLIPIGIPVSARYKTKVPKAQAKNAFGFGTQCLFVIMGGSMGYGKIGQTARALLKRMPGSQVAAVCGKNKKLFERMRKMNHVTAFEYIDNVNVLMDAADVLITKPGGLSSTEALVKGVPVVFSEPIPGGEEKNAVFLCAMGTAVWGRNTEDTADKACRLALDKKAAERMVEAQREHIERDADQKIGDFLTSLEKPGCLL